MKISDRNAPEILCQTEKIAPGVAAIGILAKTLFASVAASPEFCMPTSIVSALTFAADIPESRATPNPNKYPNRLCKITTAKTSADDERISDALCEKIVATIRQIAVTEIIGAAFAILELAD